MGDGIPAGVLLRTGYEVTLPSGAVVHIVEPTVAEVLMARRAAGSASGATGVAKVTQAALRVALRKVGKAPYAAGSPWPLGARDTMALGGRLAGLMAASREQTQAARDAVTVATGERESWTVQLDDGRTVTLSELSADAVFEAMGAADTEGARPLAGQYRMVLDGLRRSITAIDGAAPPSLADLDAWPLSAVATDILGALWMELHGLTEESVPTMVPTTG